ncbi:MAG: hypothetical protein LAO06_03540 [Acidobacteriia bacterium]|nr:hypothetical protein [Terriglobia bacterium]
MAEADTGAQPAAAPDGNPSKQPPNFLGIPLKGWAIVAVSFIVVCYTAGHFTVKLYGELAKLRNELNEEKKQNVKVNQANKDTSVVTDAVTKEMAAHEHDGSGHRVVLHKDSRGDVQATYFDSDGCIAIARPGPAVAYMPAQSTIEWLLGPTKKPSMNPPMLDQNVLNGSELPGLESPNVLSEEKETVHFRYASAVERRPKLLRVQSGCLNPHPWQFRTWWGPANGCWAAFYRQWNDGCKHYQMYNACTGQWDPRINWMSCVAQHHP